MADSRPEPGPLTLISTSRTPFRIAELAQRWAALWAAKGVLLREPLKPTQPAEAEQTALPSISVIVIKVLLNVAFMCTIARTTFFLTFRFVLFAIILKNPLIRVSRKYHFLLAFFLYTLLACNCFSRPFACTCITLRTLAPNRQAPSVTNAPVTIDIAQASYILRNLPAKLTFNSIIAVDNLRYPAEFIFTELAGFCLSFDTSLF
jgi:hypothetical protein